MLQVGRHATLRTKKKSEKELEVRPSCSFALRCRWSHEATHRHQLSNLLQDESARNEAYPNLPEPYRIQGIMSKKVKFVASGSAAAHIICIDMEGKLYAWGRNEVRTQPCFLQAL